MTVEIGNLVETCLLVIWLFVMRKEQKHKEKVMKHVKISVVELQSVLAGK